MFPKLVVLGPDDADDACQDVLGRWTRTPGHPVARNKKLSELGIAVDADLLILINQLVDAVKEKQCILDPNTLSVITTSSTYGEIEEIVQKAPRP
jgi:hypothetical protein